MNKLKQIIDMLQDEKIIEEIIGFIQWAVDRGSITEKQREKSDLWIIWLEKRAEQKTVSKTEPIIEGLTTEFQKQVSHLIASTINKEYEYTSDFIKWTANTLLNYAKHELEKKDGSNYPYQPGWRKNYSGNKPKVKHSVLMLTTHGIAEGEWLGEEWCQYRWSCKVKDTEVLYWMHLSDLGNLEKENEKQDEQKPIISDDAIREGVAHFGITQYQIDNWLKKYVDVKKHDEQHPAWSEEDENMLQKAISTIRYALSIPADKDDDQCFAGTSTIDWLKSLKNRVQPQPKQEWSEEEKARIDKIIDVLDWAEEKGHIHHSDWEDYVCYVKSLKPQNTWKPSDEQMEALWNAIPHIPNSEKDIDTITELSVLYNDLKKLKE